MHAFVYGTLTDAERVADVLDDAPEQADSDWEFVADATLHGVHRVDGRYPTLAPGGSADGRILRTDAVDVLDTYEGVGRGLYVRVRVPVVNALDDDDSGEALDGEVAVYVGDPDRLDPVESVTWPGRGDLAERVRRYVDAHDVAVERR
jgi:gamma-glutamylcyclotransferase (GGCT)/AIG2-like uncharacterized protein YtfP